MEQGFLGTIGWIKGNLMSNPNLLDKGYSNENFYPGAENIPDSAIGAKPDFPYEAIGDIKIDEDYNVTNFQESYTPKNYIKLGNMSFSGNFDVRLAFTATQSKNTTSLHTLMSFPASSKYLGLCAWFKESPRSFTNWIQGKNCDLKTINVSYGTKYYLHFTREDGTNVYVRLKDTEGNTLTSNTLGYSNTVDISGCLLGGQPNTGVYSYGWSGIIHLKECYFKAL